MIIQFLEALKGYLTEVIPVLAIGYLYYVIA